jgi:hypothetical protein
VSVRAFSESVAFGTIVACVIATAILYAERVQWVWP